MFVSNIVTVSVEHWKIVTIILLLVMMMILIIIILLILVIIVANVDINGNPT